MEEYLIKDYGVFENERHLKTEDDIESCFKECGYEFFDCGQGFYQDEATVICKIGEKFYEVDLEAEVLSSKQDVGDRLYWVENIEKVTYKEIPKPEPKPVEKVAYLLELNQDKRELLEEFLKTKEIKRLPTG